MSKEQRYWFSLGVRWIVVMATCPILMLMAETPALKVAILLLLTWSMAGYWHSMHGVRSCGVCVCGGLR